METNFLALGAVVVGGVVVGSFARPCTWRAVTALAAFGAIFLVLDITTAAWFKYTQPQIYGLLALSGAVSDSQGILGGVAIAYAAFLGALIFGVRVTLSRHPEGHEP
jgi:hypothetical protein